MTEGEKKCLKGCQESFLTIGISGVWNWSSNRQPLDDFKLILLEGREVFIVFDSDKQRNINVLKAETRLADFLSSKKSIVKIVDLPEEDA